MATETKVIKVLVTLDRELGAKVATAAMAEALPLAAIIRRAVVDASLRGFRNLPPADERVA